MSQIDISHPPSHLERLSSIIQNGECILFLGAGVSIDSGAPSGSQLADELGKHFFNLDPGAYPLDELCEVIDSNVSRKALNEQLLERFESLNPQGALLHIPRFRWKNIYTVNFDTLLEQAYRQTPDRLQALRPFYSDKDPLGRLKEGDVPLYKLYGCLSRANSEDGRLTLTQRDFARVQASRRRLFNRLFDVASDFTILYVDFSRRDHDFTQVMVEVSGAAGGIPVAQAGGKPLLPSRTRFRSWGVSTLSTSDMTQSVMELRISR